MAEQKSENATQKRLKKAKSEGQFPSSRDFVSGFQFLAFLMVASNKGPEWIHTFRVTSQRILISAFDTSASSANIAELFREALRQNLVPLATSGSILVATAMGVQLASTGSSLAWAKLQPSFKNLDPVQKLKRIPKQGGMAAVQAILLLCLLAAALYALIGKSLVTLMSMPFTALSLGVGQMRGILLDILWKACAVFLLLGVVDLFRQTRRFANDLKMTKQEVKDEVKESEGNPQMKMRVRRLMRDLRRKRMMTQVPTATAVIVNPTHYAVAIKYQHESMSTPLVVAKGKNYLALRIRQIALEHQVPLVENVPLAQALYKSVEVGQEIPPHLYRAVAEILAYIYRMMGTTSNKKL